MRILRAAKRFVTGTRLFNKMMPQSLQAVNIAGVQLFIRRNSPDIDVAESCLNRGEFDEAISAATPLVHQFIIDAGGYIGTAAISLSKAFPKATIATLEPSIANIAVLKKNVAAFPNIVAINKALAPNVGKRRLVDRWTGQWGFSTFDAAGEDCPDPVTVNYTETTTIPDLMRDFEKKGIDILKLDIEGAEFELLHTCPAWVSDVRVLFAELHDRFLPGCEAAFIRATDGRVNRSTLA